MAAYGFRPMLTLQCRFLLWWENISSGVEIRTNAPTARGELKAYLLSVIGRQKGLTRRDLPRLRFALNRKEPCPKDPLRVLLIGDWVCGARYVVCANGVPTQAQIQESDALLKEMYTKDIRRASHTGRGYSIIDLAL